MKKQVLVAGGCGYIGSHTIVDLIENGFEVISADNFLNSYEDVLKGIKAITGVKVKNYNIDLSDKKACFQLFEENPNITGVIHFAALKAVGESTEIPIQYFNNNLNSLLNVAEACIKYNAPNLIFSSSCSVYGNATELPVKESTPFQTAESPYARTKQMGEQMLEDICARYQELNVVLLRYFNPAGAHPSNLIGETPKKAGLNLVPVITETALGKRDKITVHGDDYDTRDGSCIRDYIHVSDLANAHTKGLEYLYAEKNPSNCEVFNLGIGDGVSVLEAIKAFEEVSGIAVNYEIGPRRPGDVESIYSNYEKTAEHFGWAPKYGIKEIMATAWAWEQKAEAKV